MTAALLLPLPCLWLIEFLSPTPSAPEQPPLLTYEEIVKDHVAKHGFPPLGRAWLYKEVQDQLKWNLELHRNLQQLTN
jgi:hypothetical protein